MSIELSGSDPRILFNDGTAQDTAFLGYGPAFMAHLVEDQVVDAGSELGVGAAFKRTSYDPMGWMNLSSGLVKPTIPGLYEIGVRLIIGVNLVSFAAIVDLYIWGGERLARAQVNAPTAGVPIGLATLSLHQPVFLTGTEALQVVAQTVGGTANDKSTISGTEPSLSAFYGRLVRPLA